MRGSAATSDASTTSAAAASGLMVVATTGDVVKLAMGRYWRFAVASSGGAAFASASAAGAPRPTGYATGDETAGLDSAGVVTRSQATTTGSDAAAAAGFDSAGAAAGPKSTETTGLDSAGTGLESARRRGLGVGASNSDDA